MAKRNKALLVFILFILSLLGPAQRSRALHSLGATKALTKADKTSVRNRLSGKGKKKGRGKTTKGAKHHKGSKSKGGKSYGSRAKAQSVAKRMGKTLGGAWHVIKAGKGFKVKRFRV